MANLVFDEYSLYEGSIKKMDRRLHSPLNKFHGGQLLVTYYSIDRNRTTTDRGFRNIDELLGPGSPLRYNKIKDFPISLVAPQNPDVGEDIPDVYNVQVAGECIVFPSTLSPNPDDFFIIQSLEMTQLFRVIGVDYDNMTQEQFYKLDYKLFSTDRETIAQLEKQVIGNFNTKLEDFGTEVSPIVKSTDYEYIRKLEFIQQDIAEQYKAMFYDDRHDTILYRNEVEILYDPCQIQFIQNHSLLNIRNSHNVIMLEQKIEDYRLPQYYMDSVYKWMERDAPMKYLHKFKYRTISMGSYPMSSFALWNLNERGGKIIIPLYQDYISEGVEFFPVRMMDVLEGYSKPLSKYERVMMLFATNKLTKPQDIPLSIFEEIMDERNSFNIYRYTPLILYIIKIALKLR